MLPTKFQVNCRFDSGEEAKNRFSRWPLRRPSWISDRINFNYFFYLQVTPMLPIKFQVNWFFGLGEAKTIDFQDGGHGGHLGFPIGWFKLFLIRKSPR